MNKKHQVTMKIIKSKFLLMALLTLLIVSGCDQFHQKNTGEVAKSTYLCHGLITNFINNERHFNRIRKASADPIVRNFCVWRKGLELPKGKEHWEQLIDDKITIFDTPVKISKSEQ